MARKRRDENKMAEIVHIHRKKGKANETKKYALKAIYLRWLYVSMVVLVVLALSFLNGEGNDEPHAQGTSPVAQSSDVKEKSGEDILTVTNVTSPKADAQDKTAAEGAIAAAANKVAPAAVTEQQLENEAEETAYQAKAVESEIPTLLKPAAAVWSRSYGYGYDVTWQDYRFHNGADMGLAEGSAVFAAASGQVEKITQDSEWGSRIYMNHNGGITCVYGGLTPRADLKAGDRVSAGEEIGQITASPPVESGDPSHLHFEIWLNGESQDPAVWLP